MTSYDFSTTTHAKWILAGEHAVLRGTPAIVFPLSAYCMRFQYQQNPSQYETTFSGTGEDWHIVIRGVLEKALALSGKSSSCITGHFNIENSIPLGMGLGGSAALCVAVARWIHWQGFITLDDLHEFSRQLENLFHRNSSGLDIAGANATTPLLFTRDGTLQPIKLAWQPNLYLSHSQQVGSTSGAVRQVEKLLDEQPELGVAIDDAMNDAVSLAKQALEMDETNGLTRLLKAINQAKICFTKWGLADGKVASHMQALTDVGAIACKPTGSGNGGYVLSLWTDTPELAGIELVRV